MSNDVGILLLLNLNAVQLDKQYFPNFPFESGVLMHRWEGPLLPVGTPVFIGTEESTTVESVRAQPGKDLVIIELDPGLSEALWAPGDRQNQFFSDLQSDGWDVFPE